MPGTYIPADYHYTCDCPGHYWTLGYYDDSVTLQVFSLPTDMPA